VYVCSCVYLHTRSHISKTTCQIFTKFSARLTGFRCSVKLNPLTTLQYVTYFKSWTTLCCHIMAKINIHAIGDLFTGSRYVAPATTSAILLEVVNRILDKTASANLKDGSLSASTKLCQTIHVTMTSTAAY